MRATATGGVEVAGYGVVALLVGALLLLGLAPMAMPDSYSWVEHGTSESAAQGIDGAWVARMGFLAFGLAVLWLSSLRWTDWGPLASVFHLAFGVGMLGVAAFAHKPWEGGVVYVAGEDRLHSVFAGIVGFSFILGVASVAVHRWLRLARAALAAIVVDGVALAVAVAVPLAMSTGIWGLLQRLMFLTAAAWYGREAWPAPGA